MRKYVFLVLLPVFIFPSCKRELSCEGCAANNKPPVAIAGPDISITLPIDSFSLDGSASNDPDGKISAWQWTKITGPASFSIINADSAKTRVKNLKSGTYQFELKVTDDKGLSANDTVQVVVNDPAQPNHPPVACAGADQTITLPANTVTLDGSCSSDPDNNVSTYSWTKISGPATSNIVNANAVQTLVSNLGQGSYELELKVTDAGGLFSKDTLQVTVLAQPTPCSNNNRPHLNAQLIPFGTLSQGREGMAVAAAGNKIVFAGGCCSSTQDWGSSRVDIYDLATQTWSTAELSEKRSHIAAVAAGNKIFFAGGSYGDGAFDNLYSTVDIYDVSANTWSVASLSEPRYYIAAAFVGDKVFFAGGVKDENLTTSDKVDIYNLSSNNWSTANLSEPRAYISAVTVNNKIYFAGGHKDDRWFADPSNRIDIYDNASNTWSVSTLNQPMGFLAGITVAEKIYWAESCNVEIKDVHTWSSSLANLFQPGWWWIDRGQNAVVKNGKIIFFRHGANGWADKFDIYDILTNTWSIGVLPVNILGASIISVNNRIYLAGGAVNGVVSNQVWKLEF